MLLRRPCLSFEETISTVYLYAVEFNHGAMLPVTYHRSLHDLTESSILNNNRQKKRKIIIT